MYECLHARTHTHTHTHKNKTNASISRAFCYILTCHSLQGGATQLSPVGCLVVTLFQQWLVRHLCKQLMQLMTSEAFILYRNALPSSYLENYLSFQAHFSFQEFIIKYLKHAE